MKYTKILIIAVIILSILGILAGCATTPLVYKGKQLYERVPIADRVSRFIDTEFGNVCYVYRGNGISCLPLGDIDG